jgi:hypothetical protein
MIWKERPVSGELTLSAPSHLIILFLGENMNKRTSILAGLTASVLLVSISLQTTPVFAASAVAVGIAPGCPRIGYAIGFGINLADTDTAKAKAVDGCHGSTVTSGAAVNNNMKTARSNCKVVGTFSNQCIASAIDPKDGTPGVGWAVADTQQEADEQALVKCRSTAGSSRAKFCEVQDRHCDGSAK